MPAPRKEIDEARLRRRYEDDKASLRELAPEFGMHWTSVRKRLEDMGVQIRPASKPRLDRTRPKASPDMFAVISDYLRGDSPTILAQRYGSSPDTLRRRLRREGVVLRTHDKAMALSEPSGDVPALASDLGIAVDRLRPLLVRHGFLPTPPRFYAPDGSRVDHQELEAVIRDPAQRRIARTRLEGGAVVSTLFRLGVTVDLDDPDPLLWETQIIGGPLNTWTFQYSTAAEARLGHEDAVVKARAANEAAKAPPQEDGTP